MMGQKDEKDPENILKINLSRAADVPESLYTGGEGRQVSGAREIPRGYNIDTLVIMPVNTDINFLYWEVTDELLDRRLRELGADSAELVIKVFERGNRREVSSFGVKERVGKNYIKYPASFRPLVAELGILKDGEFVGILKSRNFSGPFHETAGTGEVLWMERQEGAGGTIWIPVRDGVHDTSSTGTSTLRDYYEEAAGSRIPASSEILRTKRA